jgi:hypothetical protein
MTRKPVSAIKSRYTIYLVRFPPSLPSYFSIHILDTSEFNGDFSHNHPEVLQQRLPEIEEFAKV